LCFHELELAAKLACLFARALLRHSEVSELRVERLHLVLETANQAGERADFGRRFSRFG
jgi:hypothetical protein